MSWDKLPLPEKIRQAFTTGQRYKIWLELADWIEKHDRAEKRGPKEEPRCVFVYADGETCHLPATLHQRVTSHRFSPTIEVGDTVAEWRTYIRGIMRTRRWPESSFDCLLDDELGARNALTILNRILEGSGPPRERR